MAPGKLRRSGFRRRHKSWLGLWTAMALVVLLAGFAGVIASSQPSVGGDRLRIDVFVDAAGRNRIKDARILEQDSFVTGTYVRPDGTLGTYSAPYLRISDRSSLLALLLENRIPTHIDQQLTKRLLDPAALLIPPMILAVLIIYLFMSYRRRSGLFGIRSGARRADPKESTVTFADVAGQDAAVTELMEVKDFLSDPDRFTGVGAVVPKGILLFGPPGCGKTLLARALAAEAGAAFYSISGSDFVEVYVGVGAARMRDLFKEARDNAPAILFIDELDSVGRRRKGGNTRTGADEEQEQALNQILAELDGFSPLQGIIVVGATNRPDVLDPALLRPGRFDRTIGLERPDEPARRAILAVHARNKRLADDVDLARVASRAIGLSGADLASVMNEGALLAARAAQPEISQLELDTALERILGAPERQRRLSMRDRGFGRTMGGEHRVTFDDVAGLDEAIAELAEVRDYLAEPQRYVEMGARPPRGFLLVGPPGCGKTLLARAVAVEANAAFFSVAATQFVESLAGEGAGRVRDLFAEAKAAAPSIVFIDEVDAIGARRGLAGAYRETEQTLNQILIELDGFDARSGVMVMAASNRPEILDEALVRPGRFDRTVAISLPDRAGRRAILDVHAKGKRLASDVDLDAVARLTQGFSGADLANVMNESALLATRHRLDAIPMSAVDEAVDRVGIGIARPQILLGDELAMVAYHEAGHALVARALPGASPPHKISIVSRGRSLGSSWTIDRADRSVYSRSFLVDRMAAMLGGRAAEELVFGEPGSGAADDLHRVSDLARRMVSDYGMSEEMGPFTYADAGGRNERPLGYSEESDRRVDSEARRLVDTAYGRARAILTAERMALDRLAEALLDRETVMVDEIDRLVGPPQQRPAR